MAVVFACVLCAATAMADPLTTEADESSVFKEQEAAVLAGKTVFKSSFSLEKMIANAFSAHADGAPDADLERCDGAIVKSDSSEKEATALRSVSFTENVEELLQYPELPAGCESVALACVLESMGFELEKTDIVDSYLAIDPTYTAKSDCYYGDPFSGGTAFPPAIVAAANRYLAEQGSDYRAIDVSGTAFDDLEKYLDGGYPLLVWTTMYMDEPSFSGDVFDGYAWYFNEHCAVVYDADADTVYVSDPIEGLVERDRESFAGLYLACGAMAVVIC